MSKYIYKYTNKITGKSYIGQTNDLHKRFRGHKSEAFNPNAPGYNLPFHAAIRKYGIENFTYDVLEEIADGESQEYVDERERYFISYYQSLTTQNGYNLTTGGDGCPKPPLTYEEKLSKSKLFTSEEIRDIQTRLINDEEYDDIEAIYAPKLKRTFLVNINTGTNFFNPDFDYPLKKHAKSRFSRKEIRTIKERIKSGEKYETIQRDYNIKSASFLSMINTGRCFYDSADTYPLCSKKGSRPSGWVTDIKKDLEETDLTLEELSKKYNISPNSIYRINKGFSYHQTTRTYPIRPNLI